MRSVFYRYRYCVPVSPFFSCTGILDPDVKGRYFQIMTSLLSREFSEYLVFLSVPFLCVGVFFLAGLRIFPKIPAHRAHQSVQCFSPVGVVLNYRYFYQYRYHSRSVFREIFFISVPVPIPAPALVIIGLSGLAYLQLQEVV